MDSLERYRRGVEKLNMILDGFNPETDKVTSALFQALSLKVQCLDIQIGLLADKIDALGETDETTEHLFG